MDATPDGMIACQIPGRSSWKFLRPVMQIGSVHCSYNHAPQSAALAEREMHFLAMSWRPSYCLLDYAGVIIPCADSSNIHSAPELIISSYLSPCRFACIGFVA